MKPISINLASRPFYNETLYLVAFAVSVTLLVVMTGLNLYTFFLDQSGWNRFREASDQMQVELTVLDRQASAQERDLKRLNLGQVTQQVSAGIPDTPIGFGKTLENLLGYADVIPVILGSHPQADNIGTVFFYDILR